MASTIKANQTSSIFVDETMAENQGMVSINITSLLKLIEKQSSELEVIKFNMNSMFLVIMGSIIILMQAGFGFLEAGSIRAKNTTNILIKNFVDLTFGNAMFVFCLHYGFAFMFRQIR